MLAADSDLPSLPILEGCRRLLSPLEMLDVFDVSAVLAMEYDGVDGVTVARAVGVIECSHEAQTAGPHFFQYATEYLSQCFGGPRPEICRNMRRWLRAFAFALVLLE
jgi:hypothetical protein